MSDDWFQETQSDFFQDGFFPGRVIPEYDILKLDLADFGVPPKVYTHKFVYDESNTSPWITVVYNSQAFAEKAARALPKCGLRVYYPKCRNDKDHNLEQWMAMRASLKNETPKFIAAYGRYLFIQLPEDQETYENLKIEEEFLSGPFNQNGVDSIICKDGIYSLTLHSEILVNQAYHARRNKATDPKLVLRFRAGEYARVASGTAEGNVVQIIDNVPMHYKLKSKIEVRIGRGGSRLYVKIGTLEKL